ncbi:MAG: hypothetical protein BLITH_0091 [Brockia lithotrophica]|uniref:Protein translocase subunit SecE n=1 Tax=Brockia lithotrophica TaxID=933949 RepID=A0A2T5G534_9BACL|nr:MAG: hypothetical protein BLITH_0091 [Brockia lithotrophica]
MGVAARIGAAYRQMRAFFRESVAELKKVRWPTRKELATYTYVVLVTVAVVALFFYGLDVLLAFLLRTFLL